MVDSKQLKTIGSVVVGVALAVAHFVWLKSMSSPSTSAAVERHHGES
jgi:hypothetical protein